MCYWHGGNAHWCDTGLIRVLCSQHTLFAPGSRVLLSESTHTASMPAYSRYQLVGIFCCAGTEWRTKRLVFDPVRCAMITSGSVISLHPCRRIEHELNIKISNGNRYIQRCFNRKVIVKEAWVMCQLKLAMKDPVLCLRMLCSQSIKDIYRHANCPWYMHNRLLSYASLWLYILWLNILSAYNHYCIKVFVLIRLHLQHILQYTYDIIQLSFAFFMLDILIFGVQAIYLAHSFRH